MNCAKEFSKIMNRSIKIQKYDTIVFVKRVLNGCIGKEKLKNRSAAENRILKCYPNDFNMEPYRCPNCNHWHIGHSKTRNWGRYENSIYGS